MQSVIEKFPHDALIPLEDAAGLTDTTLSSSVSALKTSNSVKSINSSKRRRLTEIAEDASELPLPDTQPVTPLETSTPEIAESLSTDGNTEIAHDPDDNVSTSTTKAVQELGDTNSSVVNGTISKSPSSPTISKAESRPSFDYRSNDLESRPSLAISDLVRPSTSSSLHNSFSQNSKSYAHLYKSKVKLAPRPIIDSRHSSPFVRPTSSLPVGIQIRSRDQPTMFSPTGIQGVPKLPKIPQVLKEAHNRYPSTSVYNPSAYDSRPVSRGSVATMPANIRYTEDSKLTPEKKRLMKALQKRKQQQKARQLAKEGNFEELDLGKGHSQGNPVDSSKIASGSVSVGSPLVTKPNELPTRSRSTSTDHRVTAPDGKIQSETPPAGELADSTKPLSSGSDSMLRAVSSSRGDQDQLRKDELPTIKTPEAPTKDYLGSPSIATGNLQSLLSILQFPNWSGADSTSHTAVPDLTPPHSLDTTTDQVQMTGRSNGPTDGAAAQMEVVSSSSAHKSLTPESLDLDLPIEGQTMAVPVDDSTGVSLKLGNQKIRSITHTQPHDVLDSLASLKDSKSVHELEKEVAASPQLMASDIDPPDLQAIRSNDAKIQLADTMSNQESVQVLTNVSSPEALIQTSYNELTSDHMVSPQMEFATIEQYTILDKHSQVPAGTNMDGDPAVHSSEMQEIHSEDSHLSREANFMERRSRPPPITPVRNSATNSKAPSSSDVDSLLEELQGATLQEATSIVLVKTPTTPIFPTLSQQSEVAQKASTISEESSPPTPKLRSIQPNAALSPSRQSSSGSEVVPSYILTRDALSSVPRPSTRDVSPQFPMSVGNVRSISRQESLSPTGLELERPCSRKSTVSSLISQRMRAFEDKFATTSSPQQTPTSAVRAQIVTLRKVTLNTPSSAKSATSSKSSRNTSSLYPTPSPSPHNFAQRFGFGKKENIPVKNSSQETVSRLNQGVTESLPLIAVSPDTPVTSSESKEKRRSFFSSSKSRKKKTNSISSTASFQKEGRLSPDKAANHPNASRRSNSPDSLERSRSPSSVESFVSEGERKDSKRKPGLLKRLSGLGSMTHRSIAQTINEPLNEQPSEDSQASDIVAKWNLSVMLGELNVQFPETLVCIACLMIILSNLGSCGSEDMQKSILRGFSFLHHRSPKRIPKWH